MNVKASNKWQSYQLGIVEWVEVREEIRNSEVSGLTLEKLKRAQHLLNSNDYPYSHGDWNPGEVDEEIAAHNAGVIGNRIPPLEEREMIRKLAEKMIMDALDRAVIDCRPKPVHVHNNVTLRVNLLFIVICAAAGALLAHFVFQFF